jgi:hypothetical protein
MKTWEISMSSQYSKKEVPGELKNDPKGLSDPEEIDKNACRHVFWGA